MIHQVTQKHYDFVSQLQKATFKFLRDKMPEFCLLPVGSVDTSKFLREQLSTLDRDELYKIAEYLRLVPSSEEQATELDELDKNYVRLDDTEYLREAIIFICERRPSQLQRINAEPLYPSERVFWDEKVSLH